jgi:hypothetical protein
MKSAAACLPLLLALALPALAADPAPLRLADGFATPLQVDASVLASLPRRSVDASDHGTPARWEGVDVADLLRKAGAPLDKALRGDNLAKCVLFSAADGYRVVFALAEFDAAFGNSGALLADTRDGKPLAAGEGPYRLVVPREQRAGRWIRQLTRVDLLDCGGKPAAAPETPAAPHAH